MLVKLNQIVMYYDNDKELPRKVNREAWFNIDDLVSIGPAYQKGYEETTMVEIIRGNFYTGVIFVDESVEDVLKMILGPTTISDRVNEIESHSDIVDDEIDGLKNDIDQLIKNIAGMQMEIEKMKSLANADVVFAK